MLTVLLPDDKIIITSSHDEHHGASTPSQGNHLLPRTARKKSLSGNYHIILRGNNKQNIFENPQDYEKFLRILADKKQLFGFSIFAWCLMPNHIHLLIKEKDIPVSHIFRSIGSSFVSWYNAKYQCVGHLFEGRFLSEPIEDDTYFLKVVRYIHLNPVKAGLCRNPGEYPYSSYPHYFADPRNSDSDMLFGLIKRDEFEQWHKEENDDICLDIERRTPKGLTDEQAAAIVKLTSGCERAALVRSLPEVQSERVVLSLLDAGASVRQINRLTGIAIRTISDYQDKH